MSRIKLVDKQLPKRVYIRQSLTEQTDAAFIDPLSGSPKYGAWTELINSLLEEWLHGRVPGASLQPFRADFDDLAERTELGPVLVGGNEP